MPLKELTEKQCKIEAMATKLTTLEVAFEDAAIAHREEIEDVKKESTATLESEQSKRHLQLTEKDEQIRDLATRSTTHLHVSPAMYWNDSSEFSEAERAHAEQLHEERTQNAQAIEEAVQKTIEGLPTVKQFEQVCCLGCSNGVHLRHTQAEIERDMHKDELKRIEKDLLAVQEENILLEEELSRMKRKVLELQATEEITSTAVADLEKTLQHIGKSVASSARLPKKNPQSQKQNPFSVNVAIVVVTGRGMKRMRSKEPKDLSKPSRGSWCNPSYRKPMPNENSELLRGLELRSASFYISRDVWSRVEVELRQTIVQRDSRIAELKETINTRSKTCSALKRQLESFTRDRHPLKEIKDLDTSVEKMDRGSEDSKKTSSSKETAKLRIELAKRRADILFLEGELAEAKAAQSDPETFRHEVESLGKTLDEKTIELEQRLFALYENVHALSRKIFPEKDASIPSESYIHS